MTNLILAVMLSTNVPAATNYIWKIWPSIHTGGAASSNICWTVTVTYVATTNCIVEWNYTPTGTNYIPGMAWHMATLNTNPPGTNTVSFPLVPEPNAFFRLRVFE